MLWSLVLKRKIQPPWLSAPYKTSPEQAAVPSAWLSVCLGITASQNITDQLCSNTGNFLRSPEQTLCYNPTNVHKLSFKIVCALLIHHQAKHQFGHYCKYPIYI